VKNQLLEVEFTVTKYLPKLEVMIRISFYRSRIHCDEASAKSGGHVKNRLLEMEFTVKKQLPKVKQLLCVLVKVALCKMLLDQWQNFVKIYVHRMNSAIELMLGSL
jgi:hypothetical protein